MEGELQSDLVSVAFPLTSREIQIALIRVRTAHFKNEVFCVKLLYISIREAMGRGLDRSTGTYATALSNC